MLAVPHHRCPPPVVIRCFVRHNGISVQEVAKAHHYCFIRFFHVRLYVSFHAPVQTLSVRCRALISAKAGKAGFEHDQASDRMAAPQAPRTSREPRLDP